MTSPSTTSPHIPVPEPLQLRWHHQERIMFLCLDPCTWQGREYDNHSFPLAEITLPKLDTDQWCQAAVAWGAKEILFVAKHTGGFCWWQTETTDYCVKNIGWKGGKGDVLAQLAKSCAKFELNMGIYVYPGDESWGAGIGSGGKTRDPAKQEHYNAIFRRQLTEAISLAATHTRVIEIWFDGSCIIEVGDILAKHAPNAVVLQGPHATIRWVGNESGKLSPEKAWSTLYQEELETGLSTQQHSTPEGDTWAPIEVDIPLYDHFWFWAPKNERKRKSLGKLLSIYYQSAGQGAVMLLNSTPNTEGLIPIKDMELYKQLGLEISRRFDNPIGLIASNSNNVELKFAHPTSLNHLMLKEDIRSGERIQKFTVEAWDGQNSWKSIASGTHVGRKTIIPLKTITCLKIRLVILKGKAPPQGIELSAYNVLGFKLKSKQKQPISWTQCAVWEVSNFSDVKSSARFKFDLSAYITHVGLWEIQFQRQSGKKISLSEETVYQAGQVSTPGILTKKSTRKSQYYFIRTAAITEETCIELEVKMKGRKSRGLLLIRPVLS